MKTETKKRTMTIKIPLTMKEDATYPQIKVSEGEGGFLSFMEMDELGRVIAQVDVALNNLIQASKWAADKPQSKKARRAVNLALKTWKKVLDRKFNGLVSKADSAAFGPRPDPRSFAGDQYQF